MSPASRLAVEQARIEAAYAARPREDPRYSWFRQAYALANQQCERHVLRRLARHGISALDRTRILEVGCGTGQWIRDLIKWGAKPENIVGLDLLEQRLGEARRLCPRGVTILRGNAASLPLAGGMFDLVLQSTVFTSILDRAMRQQIASEMLRVVKNEGLLLWYDFHVNNPANQNVRGVTKREIRELFRDCDIDMQRITLAPPVARRLAPYSWLTCDLLGRVPWLCTHYLGVIRKTPRAI